jgi:hypothetical protein
MKLYLNQKTFEGNDNDGIYDELLSLPLSVASKIKNELIAIFISTEDARIRDKIALIFADIRDEHLLPVIIKKIEEIKYSRHITTLIYACSEYDCARWIEFFVSLAIDIDDAAYIEAIAVIGEIKLPIKLSDRIICAKRLMDYLSSAQKGSEKYEDIARLLDFIEDMATV